MHGGGWQAFYKTQIQNRSIYFNLQLVDKQLRVSCIEKKFIDKGQHRQTISELKTKLQKYNRVYLTEKQLMIFYYQKVTKFCNVDFKWFLYQLIYITREKIKMNTSDWKSLAANGVVHKSQNRRSYLLSLFKIEDVYIIN